MNFLINLFKNNVTAIKYLALVLFVLVFADCNPPSLDQKLCYDSKGNVIKCDNGNSNEPTDPKENFDTFWYFPVETLQGIDLSWNSEDKIFYAKYLDNYAGVNIDPAKESDANRKRQCAGMHPGVDILAQEVIDDRTGDPFVGNVTDYNRQYLYGEDVKAVRHGYVYKIITGDPNLGKCVVLKHTEVPTYGNKSTTFYSIYAHLYEIKPELTTYLNEETLIESGYLLGKVGATGSAKEVMLHLQFDILEPKDTIYDPDFKEFHANGATYATSLNQQIEVITNTWDPIQSIKHGGLTMGFPHAYLLDVPVINCRENAKNNEIKIFFNHVDYGGLYEIFRTRTVTDSSYTNSGEYYKIATLSRFSNESQLSYKDRSGLIKHNIYHYKVRVNTGKDLDGKTRGYSEFSNESCATPNGWSLPTNTLPQFAVDNYKWNYYGYDADGDRDFSDAGDRKYFSTLYLDNYDTALRRNRFGFNQTFVVYTDIDENTPNETLEKWYPDFTLNQINDYIRDGSGRYKSAGYHPGVDIRYKSATDTDDILAVRTGTVARYVRNPRNGPRENWGTYVVLRHDNVPIYNSNETQTVYSLYAHLEANSVPLNVRTVGNRVNVGEKIAEMGNTGNSSGRHLHFQITNDLNYWPSGFAGDLYVTDVEDQIDIISESWDPILTLKKGALAKGAPHTQLLSNDGAFIVPPITFIEESNGTRINFADGLNNGDVNEGYIITRFNQRMAKTGGIYNIDNYQNLRVYYNIGNIFNFNMTYKDPLGDTFYTSHMNEQIHKVAPGVPYQYALKVTAGLDDDGESHGFLYRKDNDGKLAYQEFTHNGTQPDESSAENASSPIEALLNMNHSAAGSESTTIDSRKVSIKSKRLAFVMRDKSFFKLDRPFMVVIHGSLGTVKAAKSMYKSFENSSKFKNWNVGVFSWADNLFLPAAYKSHSKVLFEDVKEIIEKAGLNNTEIRLSAHEQGVHIAAFAAKKLMRYVKQNNLNILVTVDLASPDTFGTGLVQDDEGNSRLGPDHVKENLKYVCANQVAGIKENSKLISIVVQKKYGAAFHNGLPFLTKVLPAISKHCEVYVNGSNSNDAAVKYINCSKKNFQEIKINTAETYYNKGATKVYLKTILAKDYNKKLLSWGYGPVISSSWEYLTHTCKRWVDVKKQRKKWYWKDIKHTCKRWVDVKKPVYKWGWKNPGKWINKCKTNIFGKRVCRKVWQAPSGWHKYVSHYKTVKELWDFPNTIHCGKKFHPHQEWTYTWEDYYVKELWTFPNEKNCGNPLHRKWCHKYWNFFQK